MNRRKFRHYETSNGKLYGPLNPSEIARLGQLENGLLEEMVFKIGKARSEAGNPPMHNEPDSVSALRAEQRAMYEERHILRRRAELWEPMFCKARELDEGREHRAGFPKNPNMLMGMLYGAAASTPSLDGLCREAAWAEDDRLGMTAIALVLGVGTRKRGVLR